MSLEWAVLNQVQELRSPWLDGVMIFVTSLGNGGIIWIICTLAALIHPRTRRLGLWMALGLILEAVCCNLVLKPLFARPRPYSIRGAIELLIAEPVDYSFPSGHTSASFAVVSALFFAGRRLWLPAGILACAIAFSRLYLYVHYPSDILAGALIGILAGWAAGRILVRFPGGGRGLYGREE